MLDMPEGEPAPHGDPQTGEEQERQAQTASAHEDITPAPEDAKPSKKRPPTFYIGITVIGLLLAAGLYYWFTTRNTESTDDAYTDGRAVSIAPQVAGQVVSLDVTDNQFVHEGEPLIHIDPRQYQNDRDVAQGVLDTAKSQLAGLIYGAEIARKNYPALLKQAQARLASAQATEVRAQADYQRQRSLPKQATTQQDIDAATAAWLDAQAQVKLAEAQVLQSEPVPQQIGVADAQVGQLKGQTEQAQARLNQADLNLSWTVVTAPQDGWITRRNVEMGNYVTQGQQIFSIVAPEVWVTANFKETQLARIRPGQKVQISVDAYPQLNLEGHVDSIQMGSG
ncbi:MAG: HlyD family secretion protein, partial [Alphaproteobacteria bacterium]|nr:HlyD family secretion protein [Alphaproteobacteria bacterium]